MLAVFGHVVIVCLGICFVGHANVVGFPQIYLTLLLYVRIDTNEAGALSSAGPPPLKQRKTAPAAAGLPYDAKGARSSTRPSPLFDMERITGFAEIHIIPPPSSRSSQ
jgi:hypothetical protein